MDSACQTPHREGKNEKGSLPCWKTVLLLGLCSVSDGLWRQLKARSGYVGGRGARAMRPVTPAETVQTDSTSSEAVMTRRRSPPTRR